MSSTQNNELTKVGKRFAFKQIIAMLMAVLILAFVVYFNWGIEHAKSVLAGGAVTIIPHIFFALKAFRYAGARSSEKVMESFYSGEKMKIVLTALLFALAFKFLAILPVPFFTSFCLVVAMPLLTPFFIKH
ncbi:MULTISPECIES: ATP synthase subunit I [Thalassotalea]|uniref:ATP synthase subunit I n=1 Tax=Thalassotalea castellviae TaxID=3075612 RepID=A0ABU3A2V5_9GAMM|nr:ATP synthase subunit I [Thalassotalea sp. W431]MDT0604275.1 ATP synthase subunit I [Thalassotalea sp. W431]